MGKNVEMNEVRIFFDAFLEALGRWKDKSDFKTYSNTYLTFVELLKASCSALHQYGMHPLRN